MLLDKGWVLGCVASALMAVSTGGWAKDAKAISNTGAYLKMAEKSIHDGCQKSQRAVGTDALITETALEKVCACTAKGVTENLQKEPTLEKVIANNDTKGIRELLNRANVSEQGKPMLVQCTEQVSKEMGGIQGMQVQGAEGKEWRPMFRSLMDEACQRDFERRFIPKGISKEQISKACDCISDGMTAKLTEKEIGEIVRAGKLNAGQLALRNEMLQYCSQPAQ